MLTTGLYCDSGTDCFSLGVALDHSTEMRAGCIFVKSTCSVLVNVTLAAVARCES